MLKLMGRKIHVFTILCPKFCLSKHQRQRLHIHTGQCKGTGGCYNKLVVAFFSTGGGVKGKKNLYLLTLLFIYKLAFILFVMTPGAQTTGNIAVYDSAKPFVI